MSEKMTTNALVTHYFNICNTAITQHKDDLGFQIVLKLVNQIASGDTITLKVVDNAGETEENFSTRFVDGEFTPVDKGELDPDARFTLERRYLQEVLDNSDEYIESPLKLNWSWLSGQD